MEQKVYLLWYTGTHGEYHLFGVYGNEDAARKAKEENQDWFCGSMFIHEETVLY